MLSIRNLSKRFGGLQVIKDVSFDVQEGTIHSIIGPNGAGKTTIFNLITSINQLDQGTIHFGGTALHKKKPHEVAKHGISRTFQNIRLFPEMSVLENIQMGQSTLVPTGLKSLLPFRREQAHLLEKIDHLLELVRLAPKKYLKATTLSYGEQRRVEIARALASGAKLILLDEPAAGMNPDESAQMVELIRNIQDKGITVLLVEHDMSIVMKISDSITVLNFGQKIAEGDPQSIQHNPVVKEAYLGKDEDEEHEDTGD